MSLRKDSVLKVSSLLAQLPEQEHLVLANAIGASFHNAC